MDFWILKMCVSDSEEDYRKETSITTDISHACVHTPPNNKTNSMV
jgi:hypothetical protein